MAILEHDHSFEPIPYVMDQRYLGLDEKTSVGLPTSHDIYTYDYCNLDGCTAVRVIDKSDNDTPHIVDVPAFT